MAVKPKLVSDAYSENMMSIHGHDACCDSNVPDTATYSATLGGDADAITSAVFNFKRNADAATESLTFTSGAFDSDQAFRQEWASLLEGAGFTVEYKTDLTVVDDAVTITGQLIPVSFVDNVGTSAFS